MSGIKARLGRLRKSRRDPDLTSASVNGGSQSQTIPALIPSQLSDQAAKPSQPPVKSQSRRQNLAQEEKHTRHPPMPGGFPVEEEPEEKRLRPSSSIVVGVCGLTGAGKSSFIGKVANKKVGAEHTLKPNTSEITEVTCHIGTQAVTLIDTPGFDDTVQGVGDALAAITAWMQASYEEGALLSGIIYLYRLTDTRMTSSSMKSIRMFHRLCSANNMKKVLLVLSDWDIAPHEDGILRDTEHFNEGVFWSSLIAKGAMVDRYDNQAATASGLVQNLVSNSPTASNFQKRLVNDRIPVVNTVTGEERPPRIRNMPTSNEMPSELRAYGQDFPKTSDILIAVMGTTGSGKSTFISKTIGRDVHVGHGLTSCTSEVGFYHFLYHGTRRVVLIDTPGFDDTNRSDTEVLTTVADSLSKTYKHDVKLTGIIYLHRITDRRMSGSSIKNLKMFKKLCGEDAYKHVVLATTMWDNLNGPGLSHQVGIKREKELLDTKDWWGLMHKRGSKVYQHYDNKESSMRIVSHLVELGTTVVLNIQNEMVNEQKTLENTSAGQEIGKDVQEMKRKLEGDIAAMTTEFQEALREDQELAEYYRGQLDKAHKMRSDAEEDIQTLKMNQQQLAQDLEAKWEQRLEEERERSLKKEKYWEDQQHKTERQIREIKAENKEKETREKRLDGDLQRAEKDRKRLEGEKQTAEKEKKRLEEEAKRKWEEEKRAFQQEKKRFDEDQRNAEKEKKRVEEDKQVAEKEKKRFEEEKLTAEKENKRLEEELRNRKITDRAAERKKFLKEQNRQEELQRRAKREREEQMHQREVAEQEEQESWLVCKEAHKSQERVTYDDRNPKSVFIPSQPGMVHVLIVGGAQL